MAFILRHTEIRISCHGAWLDAFLCYAPDVRGMVLSLNPAALPLRDSQDDLALRSFRKEGFGTLQLNLLTPYEDTRDPDVRFDVPMLAKRLEAAIDWLDHQPGLENIPLGIVAAGSTAGAAIRYMTGEHTLERISTLVSRAGRPDLAGAIPLRKLTQPTMLVLPEHDSELHTASLPAYDLLGCEKRWIVIPGTHDGLQEPNSLAATYEHASAWFVRFMPEHREISAA